MNEQKNPPPQTKGLPCKATGMALLLAVAGLAMLFWPPSGSPAWATSTQDALHQMVPALITVETSRYTVAPGDSMTFIVRVTNIMGTEMRNAFVTIPMLDPLIVEQVTATQGTVTVTLGTPAGRIIPSPMTNATRESPRRKKGLSAPIRDPSSTVWADLGTIAPTKEAVINIRTLIRQDTSPETTIQVQAKLTFDGETDSNLATVYLPQTCLPVTGQANMPKEVWGWMGLLFLSLAPLAYVILWFSPASVERRIERQKGFLKYR